jgi:hypothetical protein
MLERLEEAPRVEVVDAPMSTLDWGPADEDGVGAAVCVLLGSLIFG